MRILISLFSISIFFSTHAQRMTFEDPGLNFSVKKPKHWVLIDDGYVVKISPYMSDTAYTFLTLTYFEHSKPMSNSDGTFFTVVKMESDNKLEFGNYMWSDDYIEIAEKKVKWKRSMITKDDILIEKRFYDFDLDNKNWEIVISAPSDEFKSYYSKFKSMIRSFRIDSESELK